MRNVEYSIEIVNANGKVIYERDLAQIAASYNGSDFDTVKCQLQQAFDISCEGDKITLLVEYAGSKPQFLRFENSKISFKDAWHIVKETFFNSKEEQFFVQHSDSHNSEAQLTGPFTDRKTADKFILNLAQAGKCHGAKVVKEPTRDDFDARITNVAELAGEAGGRHEALIQGLESRLRILECVHGYVGVNDMNDDELEKVYLSFDHDFESRTELNKQVAKERRSRSNHVREVAAAECERHIAEERLARVKGSDK